MRRIRAWLSRFAEIFNKQRADRDADLAAELESHLQFHIEDNLRAGMSPEEARRQALLKLGGLDQTKESYRAQRGLPWLDSLAQDIRFALRILRKNPGFTATAILTLALGIGANTAIFSVVYGVLLRPLPYPHPDRIVALSEVESNGGYMSFADPNFNDLRTLNRSLQAVAEYGLAPQSISGGAEPTRSLTASVSADFFRAIGVQPMMGREFQAADQHVGAAPVALVSYSYWRQSLGALSDLSSFRLKIGNRLYSAIGVMPPGFDFPQHSDIWLPRELDPINSSRTSHSGRVVGRLREGITVAQARSEVEVIGKQIANKFPGGDFSAHGFALMPLRDSITGNARPALVVLLCAVGLLLLAACANVANLLLSQAAVRERELAIRSALGASRARLVWQFLIESLLLSAMAGALGVLAAFGGVLALERLAPSNLPRLDEVSVNVPALLFTVAISFFVAVGLGAFTATRAAFADPNRVLGEGGRTEATSRRAQRIGSLIASAQLAIALVLLVGAGLLGRSLLTVLSVNPGFRTDHVLTVNLATAFSDEPASKAPLVDFDEALLARLHRIPGVNEVGAASDVPLIGSFPNGEFFELAPSQAPKTLPDLSELFTNRPPSGEADYCAATEGYFQALSIPLIQGRMFDTRDREGSQPVALVSESLARTTWPGRNPIGHTLEFGNMDGDPRLLTVVGVVGDTRESGPETLPQPAIYVDLLQRPATNFTVVMHTDGDANSVFAASRSVLHDLAPEAPPQFREFSQIYSASLGSQRFNLAVVGMFAGMAFLLAMAGTYAVIAYSIARRTREIGVRMALGAQRNDVLRMLLSQGLQTVLTGIVFGIAGAFALARAIRSLLFGVTTADPLTFTGAALLLGVVGLAAIYIPARRAMRLDPMVALRHE